MKLYYAKGTCSLAVRMVLNEIGLPCEFESVNLQTKQTETEQDYWAINSKGSVPALLLDNQQLLTENGVIQQYLADSYQATELLPAVSDFKRYRVLEWLNFVSTELHKNCAPFFNPAISADVNKTVFKPLLERKLAFVDQHLATHAYLTGDNFTLPDAYLFVVLTWLAHIGIELSAYEHLEAFFKRVKVRPAIALSLQQESL